MGNESHMGVKKVFLTWEDINLLLDKINEQVVDKVRYVTGVPRGGTILAILYSHRFEVEYMERPSPHYPDMLVIDDIADTGHTLKEASQLKFITSTLAMRVGSIVTPRLYGELITDQRWLVFPWETLDSIPMQDYLVEQK